MSTYQTTQPFIYIIGWTELNAWYLGAKYAKGCQPLDLWTTYFTSSPIVASLREEWGEPDYFETFAFPDSATVRRVEIEIIRGFQLHKGTRWLNRGCFETYHPTSEEASRQQLIRFQDPEQRRLTGLATIRAADERSPVISYKGEQVTVRELSRRSGRPTGIIKERWDLGYRDESLVSKINPSRNPYMYMGEYYTIHGLSLIAGLDRETIKNRLKRGMSVEDAVKTPRGKARFK